MLIHDPKTRLLFGSSVTLSAIYFVVRYIALACGKLAITNRSHFSTLFVVFAYLSTLSGGISYIANYCCREATGASTFQARDDDLSNHVQFISSVDINEDSRSMIYGSNEPQL